jgi:hypothetical protein
MEVQLESEKVFLRAECMEELRGEKERELMDRLEAKIRKDL